MLKIKILNKISPVGLNRIPHETYEISSEFTNPDAILVRSAGMLDMEMGDLLKTIGRAGVGINNIPIDRCSQKGIVVFNTPGANANAVKELVLAALFISSRPIIDGVNYVQSIKSSGADVATLIEENKNKFVGPEIMGKKLGLIGLGAIGVLVANDAVALGMEVEGYDPYISVDKAWSLSREVKQARGMDRLLATSDFISIHVPLTEMTKGLFNTEKFLRMKRNIRILNFSRSGIVNKEDLKKAIEQKIVAKYELIFPMKNW